MDSTQEISPDNAPEDPRLVLYWQVRDQLRHPLIRLARASQLEPTIATWLVDEVLERLCKRYLQMGAPDHDEAWCVRVLKSILFKIRRLPYLFPLVGDPTDARDHEGDPRLPGIQDFWHWVEQHGQILESCCTPLEWRACLATKHAATTEEAASHCGQSTLNYRNLISRAGRKIFSAILRNLVPPVPLSQSDPGSPVDSGPHRQTATAARPSPATK